MYHYDTKCNGSIETCEHLMTLMEYLVVNRAARRGVSCGVKKHYGRALNAGKI